MKEKIFKILHLLKIDVLLLGLLEKLVLGLTKKLTALESAVERFLDR